MNNPFRYRPSRDMVDLMWKLVGAISSDPLLDSLLSEGKMLGILRHSRGVLFAYSGKRLEGAESVILDGERHDFVPPIYDVTRGYFKGKEAGISHLNALLAACTDEEEAARLREMRAAESVALQKWTFGQYKLLNARGECRSILEIFADKGLTPPAASGDCAAPKLLQTAYSRGLEPLEIGEFWYGHSPEGPVRAQGRFYPACSWKCGPVLKYMLEGLDICNPDCGKGEPVLLYEDGHIIVCIKPEGMSAVPGLDGRPSLQEWLESRFPGEVYQIHRLDQDTSGLMVFARDRRSLSCIQRQFENRQTRKKYIALCEKTAENVAKQGSIFLPLAPDYEDKPRQKVDRHNGREAVTEYRILVGQDRQKAFDFFGVRNSEEYDAVEFHPLTGRTHQLRVHAAHKDGLGSPLLGDTLYGGADCHRLCLHAAGLEFDDPVSGERMVF